MKISVCRHNVDTMCENAKQLVELMGHIGYAEFTRLKSPLEVFLTTCGSCHDQVMLEHQELYGMGLDPQAKFIMAVDSDGQGMETHSFTYFKEDDKWYWFENAWEDLKGLHEYSSEDELIDSVMSAFGKRNDFDKLYIADFNPGEHTIGEDLETLVDICMNSATEYEIT